jgi:hypothetical protein
MQPLAARFGSSGIAATSGNATGRIAVIGITALVTGAFVASHTFTPVPGYTPAAAVDVLKSRKAERILHNAGFGGYLITRGVPVFFDGRGELYGDEFLMKTFDAFALKDVGTFLGLLESYKIDATMLRPETPAASLLDHVEGWQRIYADDKAIVHVRRGAPR